MSDRGRMVKEIHQFNYYIFFGAKQYFMSTNPNLSRCPNLFRIYLFGAAFANSCEDPATMKGIISWWQCHASSWKVRIYERREEGKRVKGSKSYHRHLVKI